jgi:molybdopterin/thiamine biosynthesis adenylyltransferase/rhodanese-related sulfurtransferase
LSGSQQLPYCHHFQEDSMKAKSSHERYQRQVTLKGFGEAAQNDLLQASVLVIGAGGLGCPVLQYLTAAGTGCIGILDDDVVSITNLHRQVLYDTNDIGKPKVSVAATKLRQMNPDTKLLEFNIHLDKNNCLDIINAYDLIVDCTDNFASRYMINDACVLKGKPLVYAAVTRFEGQVAVFNFNEEGKRLTGNYRDLFPQQPEHGEVMNCAEAGVLGVLPGIIGSMQACEAIKIITGIGEPLLNKLLTYNAINNKVIVFDYEQNTQSASIMPQTEIDFKNMNYENECVTEGHHFKIGAEKFEQMLQQNNAKFIDVRELHELPLVTEFETLQIPFGELKLRWNEFSGEKIIFFCQSGTRSLQAAVMAAEHFGNNNMFYSLQGGIVSWKKIHEKQLA